MVASQIMTSETPLNLTKAEAFSKALREAAEVLRSSAYLLEDLVDSTPGDPQHYYLEGVRRLTQTCQVLRSQMDSVTKLAHSTPDPVSARRLALAQGVSTNTVRNRLKES